MTGELNVVVISKHCVGYCNVPEASEVNARATFVTVDIAVYSYTLKPNEIQNNFCVFPVLLTKRVGGKNWKTRRL